MRIGDVMPGTPAAKAGLKSGDVIVSINGKDVTDAHGLQLTISQLQPGSTATPKIIRNGTSKTVAVTLDELPGSVAAGDKNNSDSDNSMTDALDGVTVADLNADLREQLRAPADLKGAIITDVASDSNSADAGLMNNDVIVEI